MRKRIYEVIEVAQNKDKESLIYDIVMLLTIVISMIPLAFKTSCYWFIIIDIVTTVLFIVDYLLRILTSDYKLKKGKLSFLIYPFTFWAIIDLISILPTITVLNNSFRLFKLFRAIRIVRLFKLLRYSKKIDIAKKVINNSKGTLITVVSLALSYIFIAALVVFNVEPDTFDNYFDALYWATVSLTTVGYGDIYPVTTAGRIVTMVSSIVGIVIIALPSGIITAGYLEVIKEENDDNKREKLDK